MRLWKMVHWSMYTEQALLTISEIIWVDAVVSEMGQCIDMTSIARGSQAMSSLRAVYIWLLAWSCPTSSLTTFLALWLLLILTLILHAVGWTACFITICHTIRRREICALCRPDTTLMLSTMSVSGDPSESNVVPIPCGTEVGHSPPTKTQSDLSHPRCNSKRLTSSSPQIPQPWVMGYVGS